MAIGRARLAGLLVASLVVTAEASAQQAPAARRSAQAASVTGTRAHGGVDAEPGPLERKAAVPSPEHPIPALRRGALPAYPEQALGTRESGTVTLRVTIDDDGRVREARHLLMQDHALLLKSGGPPLDGPTPMLGPEFSRLSLDAVRQWRYERPDLAPLAFYVQLAFAPGEDTRLSWQDARAPASAAPHLSPPRASAPGAPVRVGGDIKAPRKTKDVRPRFPEAAKGVGGAVILDVTVDVTGHVSELRVLRSVPELDQAVLDAVQQWEFTPTVIDGAATPVVLTVVVNFAPR